MKRLLALGIILFAVLPSCSNEQRPEGIVERWLLSLNQGVAGRPDRYAADELSQRIVPEWERRDPGWLDRIEVGRIAPDGGVPFRIVDIDGHQTEGLVQVSDVRGDARVTSVVLTGSRLDPLLPSAGGPAIERITPTLWIAAIAVAAALSLLAALVVMVVRRTAGGALT